MDLSPCGPCSLKQKNYYVPVLNANITIYKDNEVMVTGCHYAAETVETGLFPTPKKQDVFLKGHAPGKNIQTNRPKTICPYYWIQGIKICSSLPPQFPKCFILNENSDRTATPVCSRI